MKNLSNLMKYLKTCYENIFVLHHNIVSANYFADHEKMAEYYTLVEEIADSAIEHALAIDVPEPSIKDCFDVLDALSANKRGAKESYSIVYEYFTEICEKLEECKSDVPDYFKNIMEEWQSRLALEADFKIAHLLEGLGDDV